MEIAPNLNLAFASFLLVEIFKWLSTILLNTWLYYSHYQFWPLSYLVVQLLHLPSFLPVCFDLVIFVYKCCWDLTFVFDPRHIRLLFFAISFLNLMTQEISMYNSHSQFWPSSYSIVQLLHSPKVLFNGFSLIVSFSRCSSELAFVSDQCPIRSLFLAISSINLTIQAGPVYKLNLRFWHLSESIYSLNLFLQIVDFYLATALVLLFFFIDRKSVV